MSKRWIIFTAVTIVSFLADLATKVWAKGALEDGQTVVVIQNFWEWRLSFNFGSAFSMFSGARTFLTVVGVAALGFVVWMVKQARDDQKWLATALGLVAGGAVGNLLDRMLYGKVTDFVVWKYHTKEWPTFNIADVTLVIGIGILLIHSFREGRDEAKDAAQTNTTQSKGKAKGKANPKGTSRAAGNKA